MIFINILLKKGSKPPPVPDTHTPHEKREMGKERLTYLL